MADTGWTTPTLRTIRDRIAADLRAELPDEASQLRRSYLYVLATVLSGVVWLLYLYLDWIARQTLVDTASTDNLERHAAVWGLTPTYATVATGSVTFTGTNGTAIPAGTVVQRLDGVRYTTDAEGTISSGTATVAVTAEEAGADGNADDATAVYLVTAISGIDTEAAIDGDILDGADDESSDSLRARVLERIRTPPQGGAEADYIAWAQAASGAVENVWPIGGRPGPGKVTLYFGVTWDGSDPSSVLPSSGQVATVLAYLEARIPVGVSGLTVAAPAGDPIDMTIALDDDTAANRAAVTAELNALFQRRGEPGGTDIRNSEVRQAIGRATETYDLTSLDGDGTGASDLTQGASTLVYLGTITWA